MSASGLSFIIVATSILFERRFPRRHSCHTAGSRLRDFCNRSRSGVTGGPRLLSSFPPFALSPADRSCCVQNARNAVFSVC